ncbi:leucyl aminopeptidase family protein [Poriferisphaera sp. WC338]|uniref:leucyl aminopeptidase family protein n=1 Tax=Poriferisphaera sp. WC338 TaxID=3425129 RepID=UPI003D81BDEE
MYRTITVQTKAIDVAEPKYAADAVGVFLNDKLARVPAALKAFDAAHGGVIAEAIKREEWSGAPGCVTRLYPSKGAKQVIVVGVGEQGTTSGNDVRLAAANLCKAANAAGIKKLVVIGGGAIKKKVDAEIFGAWVGDGFAQANFVFNKFKGTASGEKPKVASLQVMVEDGVRKGLNDALKVGMGVSTARRLAATPPNVASVKYIEKECKKLAREVGMKCSVVNQAKAKELGMGGLLAVGSGSKTPPAMIVLEWKGGGAKEKPILLVGKSITFDTGGYSLKPDGGKGMKYDKCGGMTVIGIMEATARLKVKQNVVAVICAAENMIDAEAYRVDDIITFYNGVTCEVTNTDAEGRLVLADGLAWGTKQFKPRVVLDMATLTGGVVVALGSYCAGVFSTDEKLTKQMQRAADVTGERVWELPLWDDHRGQMKGTHADLVNSANREAHPIQGAAFLSHFVGEDAAIQMPSLPWMHLDIAGVASFDAEKGLYAKGPSGWGVKLVTAYLQNA